MARLLNRERNTCKACGVKQTINNSTKGSKTEFQTYCQVCNNLIHAELRLGLKMEVLAYYSNNGKAKCNCCGENRYEFLTLDHIYNDGGKERKELNISGGWNFYRYLKKNNYPPGYSTLCFNCNSTKGAYGYCPHDREKLLCQRTS